MVIYNELTDMNEIEDNMKEALDSIAQMKEKAAASGGMLWRNIQ